MRIKEIEVQGSKFSIASLSIDQIELFFPGGKAKIEGGQSIIKQHSSKIIAASLNNAKMNHARWFPNWPPAAPAQPGEQPEPAGYNPEFVCATMDLTEVTELYEEITKFTGLSTTIERIAPKVEGKDTEGEGSATTAVH